MKSVLLTAGMAMMIVAQAFTGLEASTSTATDQGSLLDGWRKPVNDTRFLIGSYAEELKPLDTYKLPGQEQYLLALPAHVGPDTAIVEYPSNTLRCVLGAAPGVADLRFWAGTERTSPEIIVLAQDKVSRYDMETCELVSETDVSSADLSRLRFPAPDALPQVVMLTNDQVRVTDLETNLEHIVHTRDWPRWPALWVGDVSAEPGEEIIIEQDNGGGGEIRAGMLLDAVTPIGAQSTITHRANLSNSATGTRLLAELRQNYSAPQSIRITDPSTGDEVNNFTPTTETADIAALDVDGDGVDEIILSAENGSLLHAYNIDGQIIESADTGAKKIYGFLPLQSASKEAVLLLSRWPLGDNAPDDLSLLDWQANTIDATVSHMEQIFTVLRSYVPWLTQDGTVHVAGIWRQRQSRSTGMLTVRNDTVAPAELGISFSGQWPQSESAIVDLEGDGTPEYCFLLSSELNCFNHGNSVEKVFYPIAENTDGFFFSNQRPGEISDLIVTSRERVYGFGQSSGFLHWASDNYYEFEYNRQSLYNKRMLPLGDELLVAKNETLFRLDRYSGVVNSAMTIRKGDMLFQLGDQLFIKYFDGSFSFISGERPPEPLGSLADIRVKWVFMNPARTQAVFEGIGGYDVPFEGQEYLYYAPDFDEVHLFTPPLAARRLFLHNNGILHLASAVGVHELRFDPIFRSGFD